MHDHALKEEAYINTQYVSTNHSPACYLFLSKQVSINITVLYIKLYTVTFMGKKRFYNKDKTTSLFDVDFAILSSLVVTL